MLNTGTNNSNQNQHVVVDSLSVGKPVSAGSAITASRQYHDGKTILLDNAAGSKATLPPATGSGAHYRFVVGAATENTHVIQVTGTDVFSGSISGVTDSDGGAFAWGTAVDSDTITLSTTGTVPRGEWIEVEDLLPGIWFVRGLAIATGLEVSPFSAAVG